jgi:hypothetical protein
MAARSQDDRTSRYHRAALAGESASAIEAVVKKIMSAVSTASLVLVGCAGGHNDATKEPAIAATTTAAAPTPTTPPAAAGDRGGCRAASRERSVLHRRD